MEEQVAVFVGSSLRLAMPLMLAATGELISERAGVLNMSIEGMMLTSAFASAVGSWSTGSPMFGLACGMAAVLPMALAQGYLSIKLRANQIVTHQTARQSDRHRNRHQYFGAGRNHFGVSPNFWRSLARADSRL